MEPVLRSISIQGRQIGPGQPAYVIAELSANHHHDFEKAVQLMRAAKVCGADAVKLQTYSPDTMTISSANEPFQIGEGTIWEGKNLYDLYSEAYMPWEWQPELMKIAEELGLHLFSTPFDATAVDFLERIGVPAYKIASFEIVDLPLLRKVAATRKPIILSTGMATLEEIHEATQTLREAGARELALLKCTSAYPALLEEMHLRAIPVLNDIFGAPIGLSDHSLGFIAPVVAVALGAHLVEKHLTLSRRIPGPDSAFSLEPEEFRHMVQAIREAERALGEPHFGTSKREASSRLFRRSLFVVEDVKEDDEFTARNVRSIRPGHGLHPRYLDQILGCRASRDVKRGTPLDWSLVTKAKARCSSHD